MKRILTFLVFFFAFLSFNHAQNYSIKNRWNTKLSLSYNRTNDINIPLMHWEHIPIHPFQAKLNMRAECNYGILNWLELGGYIGYMRYHNLNNGYKHRNGKYLFNSNAESFAPTFGINVNVHLLPFFVDNKDCRWELYVTAKYGGAYLINHVSFYTNAIIVNKQGHHIDFLTSGKRYRHEFGVGMGGGVYFWDVFGLYAETLVGQYSYFPELFSCYYTVRAGIEFKFYSNKQKKTVTKQDDEIIFH
jgi:hypothetical protein